MKALASLSMLTTVALLTGCISEDEKKKIEQAGVDLNKLANQIIVTAPAADSQVSDASVIVRADIPSDVEAKSVTLLVDGVEVGKDDDGAPWEISWPAYYWGDGNKHSLLLKTVSGTGVELRNEPTSVTVSHSVNTTLKLTSDSSTESYTFGNSTTLTFTPVDNAKHYEFDVAGDIIQSDEPEVTLDSLSVGLHEIKYRAVLDNASQQTFTGPYSTVTNVQVQAPYSADQLAITPTKGSLIIEDANSIELQLAAVDDAASYEIEVDGVVSALQTNTTTLTDLTIGSHAVRYRVLFSDENAGDYTGAFSPQVSVTVAQPDAPTELQASAAYVDDSYQLTLSWAAMDNTQSYEVELTNPESRPATYTSETNQLQISDLVLGEYKWKVRRINSVQQASEYTVQESVNVGIFRKKFGGTGDDQAVQIVKSNDGGYIVLARTSSAEVSANIQGFNDDWVFKLNRDGELINQYIERAEGHARYSKIYVDKFDSVYVIGSEPTSKRAIINRLNSDLTPAWNSPQVYSLPNSLNEYSFTAIVNVKDKLIVSGRERLADRSTVDYLHEVDAVIGTVSDPIAIPRAAGEIGVRLVKDLFSNDGELIVVGLHVPDSGNPMSDSRSYFMKLSSTFQQVSSWRSDRHFEYFTLSGAELKDNRIYFSGRSGALENVYSTVSLDGNGYRRIQDGSHTYSTGSLGFLNGGGVVLFSSQNSDSTPVLREFNSLLQAGIQKEVVGEGSWSWGRGIVTDANDAIILLLNHRDTADSKNNIVIRRIPPIK